jgi:hypothetical protein
MRIDVKRVPYDDRLEIHIIEVEDPSVAISSNCLSFRAKVNRTQLAEIAVRLQEALSESAAEEKKT